MSSTRAAGKSKLTVECGILGFLGRSTVSTDELCGEGTHWDTKTGRCESSAVMEGHLTRYWDCCKPSCAWQENVRDGSGVAKTCDRSDGTTTLTDANAKSACDGGPATACFDNVPFASTSDPTLAYGFVAAKVNPNFPTQKSCGSCFEVTFTGEGEYEAADPGSQKLKGKRMIVQSTNIGADVGDTQFDLMVPGGGVGLYNGCSGADGALGGNESDLGETKGGIMATCKKTHTDLEDIKACIQERCEVLFSDKPNLKAGCDWFVNWYEAADNPRMTFKAVHCPTELTNVSGISGVPLVDVQEAFVSDRATNSSGDSGGCCSWNAAGSCERVPGDDEDNPFYCHESSENCRNCDGKRYNGESLLDDSSTGDSGGCCSWNAAGSCERVPGDPTNPFYCHESSENCRNCDGKRYNGESLLDDPA